MVGSRRDPWFDNARWLAGSLVVLVHVTSPLIGTNEAVAWAHTAFWPARLPLFALLVGYFTPPMPGAREYSSLLRMVVFPLVVVTAAHVALTALFKGGFHYDILRAQYTLWFLMGVIVWRLVGPIFQRFKHPILMAVVVSLMAGMLQHLYVFELQKILGFLPFVMIGMALRRDDGWIRRRTAWTVAASISIVVAWLVVVTLLDNWGLRNTRFIGMVDAYETFGHGDLVGLGGRLLVLIAGALGALAVLHLMPRGAIPWISYIGAGGYTIYLLHGLVLRILWEYKLLPGSQDAVWWTLPALIAFGFLLAALLGSKPVRWLTRPLVRPKLRWLLKPVPEPPAINNDGDAPVDDAPTEREPVASRE